MYCPICGESVDKDSFDEHLLSTHTQEEVYEVMEVPRESERRMSRGINFQKLYATNFEILETEHDVRLDVLNERRTHPAAFGRPEIIEFISESQVIMRPAIVKKLYLMLGKFIENNENEQGQL
tara:strand:- start:460 stop:828 length:369 start_codon:yes stop_codon:yes gene_type:complete